MSVRVLGKIRINYLNMNINCPIIRTSATLIICMSLMPLSVFAQQPADQIAAEINRTMQTATSLKLNEAESKQYLSDMETSKEYLRSGYLLISLYQLQLTQFSLMSDEYRISRSDLQQKGIEAFEQDWRQLGMQLVAKERRVAYKQSSRLPAAVKAMIESALTQIRPYYVSGRLYGLNTTITDGLVYLGQSSACADFALFAQQLHFAETSPPLRLRSLAPELAKLEAEVVHAFSQPGATAQQIPYIHTNVTLKMAQELDKEKRYYGALHQYLAANRVFASITLNAPLPSLTELKSESEKARSRLAGNDIDHSIGLLYWQLAQSSIDRASNGTNEEANIKRAAIILKSVLPRYFDYMNGVKK